ncbi:MAG: hypothetical protein AABX29_07055 [Nanoarchaeota archaeon]
MENKTDSLEKKALEVPKWFKYGANIGLVATQLTYLSSSVALMMGINEEFPRTMELILPAYMVGAALGMFPVKNLYSKGMNSLANKLYSRTSE